MAGQPGRSGGARSGAGRPSLREKYATKVNAAEKLYAGHLTQSANNLTDLADGKAVRVEVEEAPAGTVTREDIARDKDGNPILNERGQAVKVRIAAFPDRPADEMVVVKRKTIMMGPDREANQYITDRILGKPVQAQEISGPDGSPLTVGFEEALNRVWGDPEGEKEASAAAAEGDAGHGCISLDPEETTDPES